MGMDFDVNVSVKTTGKDVIDNLEKQLDKIKNNSVELKIDLGGILGGNSNIGKQFENIGKQASVSMAKGIKSVKIDNPIDFAKFKKEQKEIIDKYSNEMQSKLGLKKPTADSYAKQYHASLVREYEKYKTQIANVDKKFNDTVDKIRLEESKFSLTKSNITSAGGKQLGSLGYEKLSSYINQAEQAQSRLNAELKKGSSANLDNINSDLKEFTTLSSRASKEYQKLMTPASAIKQETLLKQAEAWGKKNPKAIKAGTTQWNDLISSLSNGTITDGQLKDAEARLKKFKAEMAASGKTGFSFGDNLKKGFEDIAQFIGTYGTIQKGIEYAKEMVVAVRDVNAANIELRKVSDASDFQIGKYFDEAAESAKKYGATISDIISTTADWSRLGYNLNDAKKLSDTTIMLKQVGDNMTQESSAEGMISTLKGFQLQAGEAKRIVDITNQVANTQPIDTSGLFTGLEKSASSMNAANNTLEQTVALITAAKFIG